MASVFNCLAAKFAFCKKHYFFGTAKIKWSC